MLQFFREYNKYALATRCHNNTLYDEFNDNNIITCIHFITYLLFLFLVLQWIISFSPKNVPQFFFNQNLWVFLTNSVKLLFAMA